MNQIPNIEETHNTRDNSPAQVFNRREWLTMNWFTIEELDAADDKGFIGNKYGIACYLSTFIPTSSQSIPYRFVATDDIDDKEVYKGEAIVDIAELEAYIHHQLQKARPEGYEQGYTQGKFNEKMDAEYKHPEELQKARQDGYNAGLADGTDKPLLAIEQRVQKAREDERDRIKALFPKLNPNSDSWGTTEMERILKAIDQSELDQDKK